MSGAMASSLQSAVLRTAFLAAAWTVVITSDIPVICPGDAMQGERVTYQWSVQGNDVTRQHGREKVYLDPNQKLVAVKGDWSADTGQYATWQIYDFPRHYLFTIKGDNCVVSSLDGSFRFADCMPQDSQYGVMNSFIGVNAFNKQMIVLNEFVYNSTGKVYSSWQFIQRPLLEHVYAVNNGQLTLTAVHYQNVVKNITDPGVFVPPSVCKT